MTINKISVNGQDYDLDVLVDGSSISTAISNTAVVALGAYRGKVFAGSTSTEASTAAKAVTVDDTLWNLQAGNLLLLTSTNTNSAANTTFAVNSGAAKTVKYGGASITAPNLDKAGSSSAPQLYVYDGTNWIWLSGTSISASRLNNTAKVGDTNKPVYFTADGVPAAISYTISKSVPSDAVFTDTTYESKNASSGGSDVSLVTTGEKYTWNNKGTYSKPSGGIPSTDLTSEIQTSLSKADSALQSSDITSKAEKNEMSVVVGTGANSGKTTITLKAGTSATVLTEHLDITGKADKDTNAVIGNVALFNASGNPIDSGIAMTNLAQKANTLSGYGITDAYTKSETYTKTEVNGLVDTPHQNYVTVTATNQTTAADDVLPASGQSADTIYRVSNWDGNTGSYDVTTYSEYAWDDVSNPNKYVFLCVESQIGEVFDISVYNNNATYADLAAALGASGANVPAEIRRGGMSVKFVQSSDNIYKQYRLKSTSFSTNEYDWQEIGIADPVYTIYADSSCITEYYYDLHGKSVGSTFSGNKTRLAGSNYLAQAIQVKQGDIVEIYTKTTSGAAGYIRPYALTDTQNVITDISPTTSKQDLRLGKILKIQNDGTLYLSCDGSSTSDFKAVIMNQAAYDSRPVRKVVNVALTSGSHYDVNSQLVSGGYYAELDVTSYVGCLANIHVNTSSDYYCYFVDEDGRRIANVFNSPDVPGHKNIILPVPRAIKDLDSLDTQKDATRLRISSTDATATIEITVRCEDKRLKGLNIGVVGDSSSDYYFNNSWRYNYGWFLYHLAPLFGYNIYNCARGGASESNCRTQLGKIDTELANDAGNSKKTFDIILWMFTGVNAGYLGWTDSYDDMVKGIAEEIMEQGSSNLCQNAKNAISGLKKIMDDYQFCKIYMPFNFIIRPENNDNDLADLTDNRALYNQIKYYNNVQKAFADCFNATIVDFGHKSTWREWSENANHILSADVIHATTPIGGYDMMRVIFAQLWNDFAFDGILNND